MSEGLTIVLSLTAAACLGFSLAAAAHASLVVLICAPLWGVTVMALVWTAVIAGR